MPAQNDPVPIRFEGAPVVESDIGTNPFARAGAFDQLFTDSTAQSYADLVRDIRLAPGGVIIDVRLPPDIGLALRGVGYDVQAHALWVDLNGRRIRVSPSPDPRSARAAFAFILDRRVAAADIRPASNEVAKKFLLSLPPSRTALRVRGHEADLLQELLSLSEVNLHPALADTTVGKALVHSDEIIFDALGDDELLLARESQYRGLAIREVRALRDNDLVNLHANPNSRALKSILSATQTASALRADELALTFPLRYEIFYIPPVGDPQRLETLSQWLGSHDEALKAASSELRELISFAAAAAVFRTALERNLPMELLGLAELAETGITPRFLCRAQNAAVADRCKLPYLRQLVE